MRSRIISFLVSFVITTSAFSTANVGSVYAQNQSNFTQLPEPRSEQTIPVPSSQPDQGGQSMVSGDHTLGFRLGITAGVLFGTSDGGSARNAGLGLNSTNNYYQPPPPELTCRFYQDFAGTLASNASSFTCDQNQQQVNDFFVGFNFGYPVGYNSGFVSAYYLDELFGSLAPPPGQSQTQPPIRSEGLFGPGGTGPPQPEGTQMVPVPE